MNARSAASERSRALTRVWLEFKDPAATTVAVAGSFNHWRPESMPMLAWGEGRWFKELHLPPNEYEYCLVVDGKWIPDPDAYETTSNPFGGRNSVLRVAPQDAAR